MSEISGKLINFKYRVNPSVDWITIVCTEDTSFTINVDIATKETNCGIKAAPGIPSFSASGNAVQNVEPTASQGNYQDIKALIIAGTKVEFQYISAADTAQGFTEGEAINNFGNGYFGEVVANAAASSDGFLSFSWNFTGVGTLDDYDES